MSGHTKGITHAVKGFEHVRINTPCGRGIPFADCSSTYITREEAVANAKRTALTWNCHDELVDGYKNAMTFIDGCLLHHQDTLTDGAKIDLNILYKRFSSILTKVKDET